MNLMVESNRKLKTKNNKNMRDADKILSKNTKGGARRLYKQRNLYAQRRTL